MAEKPLERGWQVDLAGAVESMGHIKVGPRRVNVRALGPESGNSRRAWQLTDFGGRLPRQFSPFRRQRPKGAAMSNISRFPNEDPPSRTVTLSGGDACYIRGALAVDMIKTSAVIREQLEDFENGDPVGLSDARDWIASLADQAALLEKVDPPGWREPFGRADTPEDAA